jgi:hypothetical protein
VTVSERLEIRLPAQRIRPRRREHFVRAHRRKMAREALEHVTIRAILLVSLDVGRTKQRCARLHALAACEAGVPGDQMINVTRRAMTELATPFGHEKTSTTETTGRLRGWMDERRDRRQKLRRVDGLGDVNLKA